MNKRSSRRAFTLVEMLVASALIIFMMYVIASAFEKGLTSFRILRAQGEMQEKLRAAASAIRLDLTAPHFGDGTTLGEQKLNDQTWVPQQKGYFRVCLPYSSPGTADGTDQDNPAAQYWQLTPSTAQDLYLQFTVNLTDGHPAVRDARGRRDQFLATQTGAIWANPYGMQEGRFNQDYLNGYSLPEYNRDGTPSFTSYWAEVSLFAKPSGRTTDSGVPLFDLYRRQVLLVEPTPSKLPTSANVPNIPNVPTASQPRNVPANSLYFKPPLRVPNTGPDDVSSWFSGTQLPPPNQMAYTPFNSAADVTAPFRRWGMITPIWSPTAPGYVYGQRSPAVGSFVPPFPTILDEAGGNFADPNQGPRIGGDLLLTDVVNLEIKVLWDPVRYGAPNTDRFFYADGTPATGQSPDPDMTEPSATYTVPGTAQTYANPDYPFDLLPLGFNPGLSGPATAVQAAGALLPQTQQVNFSQPVRAFDSWSSNRDTDPNHTPPQYDYNFGPELYIAAQRAWTPLGAPNLQPELGAWNGGHFSPNPVWPTPPANSATPSPMTPGVTQYTIPLRVKMRAIQIKLRIWDQKTNQTRQMTIIQDL